ncbi:sorting nexin-30 isoform X2 [Hydra vulgaris]|uniref:sorting nexin-30 isoform X2 n=2 Tax=Hydra vulgaris TaxID=6087 RepID=UPI001F5F93BA|nr:sorting nexin-30 isoform X2 [Hydra vulgaris]
MKLMMPKLERSRSEIFTPLHFERASRSLPENKGFFFMFSNAALNMQENTTTMLKLAKSEQQLHEALEKHKKYAKKLKEKEEQLLDTKKKLEASNIELQRERKLSEELYEKLKKLEAQLHNFENQNPVGQNDVAISDDLVKMEINRKILEEQLNTSTSPIASLMLSCTLCLQRICISDLETHSHKCSIGPKMKTSDPNLQKMPDILISTVTTSDSSDGFFYRVISKATLPKFKNDVYAVERSSEEFVWFRKALEELYPWRIIPPIIFTEDLNGNVRELQRFLSRICAHKMLRSDSFVRKFLTATNKELEKTKKSYKKQVHVPLSPQKPHIEAVNKEGLLYRAQIYISSLIENIETLLKFFRSNVNNSLVDGLQKCFLKISESEANNTYLKVVAMRLGNIIGDLENKSNVIYDESNLIEDLSSILEYVRSADELLIRVEHSINTLLYWEEEMRVLEEINESTNNEEGTNNQKELKRTQSWAEASSNCHTAHEELERICRNLSTELSEFDLRKEQELKEVFIEYADSRVDVFQKLQSKWFGIRLVLDTEIVRSQRAFDTTDV